MVHYWQTEETRKPNTLLDTYWDRPTKAEWKHRGFSERQETPWPPLCTQRPLSPPDLLPKQVWAAENGNETLWPMRERGWSRDSLQRKQEQGRLLSISEGTTEVLDICRTPCKLALKGVCSFNIRSYHIPFNDIISLQSWFSRVGVIKTQVLCKYECGTGYEGGNCLLQNNYLWNFI